MYSVYATREGIESMGFLSTYYMDEPFFMKSNDASYNFLA